MDSNIDILRRFIREQIEKELIESENDKKTKKKAKKQSYKFPYALNTLIPHYMYNLSDMDGSADGESTSDFGASNNTSDGGSGDGGGE